MMRGAGSLAALALVGLALAGCPSTGEPAPAATDAGVSLPPTATCTGDAARCVQGSVSLAAFKATPSGSKVELHRVFPTGQAPPLYVMPLAQDGKYAFSDLDPWGHYFVRPVVAFGSGVSATSIAALRGPVSAGATADVALLPAQLEVLEINANGKRQLQYASAHVYDPASGQELMDATVSFQSNGLAPTPMPFTKNAGGGQSYFASLTSAPVADGGFRITVAHAALGPAPVTYDMTPEAPRFTAPTLTAPSAMAMVPAGKPLAATWNAANGSDYALVELFRKNGTSFAGVYTSPASIGPDVTSETIPGSALAAGSYLLNVDAAQAGCQIAPAQGCTYLLQPASAEITAQ